METDHVKAAERESTLVAVIASTTRFECVRPRLWIKVDGPEKSDVLIPPERPRPPDALSVEDAAREEGLKARHRAEVDHLKRWLREQGHQPGISASVARVSRSIRLPDGTELRETKAPTVAYPTEIKQAGLHGSSKLPTTWSPTDQSHERGSSTRRTASCQR